MHTEPQPRAGQDPTGNAAAVVFGSLIARGITWMVPIADELEWLWSATRYGAGVQVGMGTVKARATRYDSSVLDTTA